jgi:hypothetical protein
MELETQAEGNPLQTIITLCILLAAESLHGPGEMPFSQ